MPFGSVSGAIRRGSLIKTHLGSFAEKYTIVKQIGEGAGGKAYIVTENGSDEKRVAKEAHGDDTSELQDEIKWMSELSHTNIARIFESIQGKDWNEEEQQYKKQCFLITEFAAGLDLFKFMSLKAKSHTLSEEWIAGVMIQAMKGVAYLHGQNVLHNDLKPDNLLMMEEFDGRNPTTIPRCVITDFGRSQKGGGPHQLGDPRYQSPQKWVEGCHSFEIELSEEEQERYGRENDGKNDVWSMGATLFELLSGGKLPFLNRPMSIDDIFEEDPPSKSMHGLCHAILGEDGIEKHMQECQGISPEASDLIKLMMKQQSEERYSAQQVIGHRWFSIKGCELRRDVTASLQINTTKGTAHAIFLQALTEKVQRTAYDKVQPLFEKHDGDNDGVLDFKEFEAACAELGKDSHDARKIFDNVDTDKDGTVNFNEFMVATFDWKSLKESELKKYMEKLLEDIDSNKDGGVDLLELQTYFTGVFTDGQIEETFKIIDADQSGHVTHEELTHFLFEPMAAEELEKYTEAMHEAPVECCEVWQPESLVAVSAFAFVAFSGLFNAVGLGACLVGVGATSVRIGKTKWGHDKIDECMGRELRSNNRQTVEEAKRRLTVTTN